jgi:hypothetical protein
MNSDTVPSTGNACDMAIITVDGPRANSDTVSTIRNTPITIDVFDNDDYPPLCTPELSVLEDSYNDIGVATVSSGKIVYTPDAGKSGIDSVLYQLKCNDGRTSTAKVYVIVSNPLSLQYVACPNATVTMGFDAINGVTYHWYNAETGGSIVSGGNSVNTLTITKGSAADISTWWVEARTTKFVFPRHHVDLELSDNCGTTNPQGCAATGRILWKEDFDRYDNGLNPGSHVFSTEPLASEMTTYKFATTDVEGANASLYAAGYYGLIKHGEHNWVQSYFPDDHTSPNNNSVGRLFMANGSTSPDKLYQQTIDNLCPGMELYFSFWVKGWHALFQWTIRSSEDNSILATFSPAALGDDIGNIPWKLYGFKFFVPENVESVYFDVYNYNTTRNNDFAIDDIEIRLCTPPVTTNIIGNDTIVCAGNNLDIIGTYEADCVFGNDLAYFWEFRHVDSATWKPLIQRDVTIDCAAANPADRTITDILSIVSATKADEGYYRMLMSSPAHIGSVNCRASSDSVYVHIVDKFVAPDLRIQICPSPPNHTVQLSKYLDSTDYNRVEWGQVSPYPVITNSETGLIQNANLYRSSTYTFQYTLRSPEHSGCGESTARVYMRVLNNRVFGKTVDTIVICSALATSRFVNLNQISGLELGGAWSYNSDNVFVNNTKEFVAPSKYAGAIVFNAQKAFAEADNSYNVSYKGVSGKAFDFVYTASSCIGVTKRIVLVVTL